MTRTTAILLTLAATFLAQPAAAQGGTRAAFLYTYRLSNPAQFDQAYRHHLDWHRNHQDRLTWYAWNIISGPRTGMFVDGTFGSDLAGIDQRPDPAGDGADFTNGPAHYATAVNYSAWTLWQAPSTDLSLEEQRPTPVVDAMFITPRPGAAASFESLVSGAAAHATRAVRWAWYRSETGQTIPSYMIVIPREHWADLEGRPHSLGAMAAKAYGLTRKDADRLDSLIDHVDIETWHYRPDLSAIPPKS